MLTYQSGAHAILPKTAPHPSALLWALYAALLTYVAFKIVLLLVLGINTQYLMDEYALAESVKRLDGALYRDTWPSRTILYAVYYRLAFWLGGDSVEIMRIARIQSLGLSLASLVVLYGIARGIGRNRLSSLLVLALALSVSSFMERAFMVRPEPLALLIALLALWTVVRWPDRMAACLAAGVLAGAAFLTTQKAAYFDLALGVALVGNGLLRCAPIRALALGFVLCCGWAAAVGIYVGVFAVMGAEPAAVLKNIFFGAAAANATTGHQVYDGLRGFVLQTFERNISVYLVCLLGIGMAIATIGRRRAPERIALLFSVVIAILIYGVHPAPWPYNFIMAIPFLALWGPVALEAFRRASTRNMLIAWGLVLVLIVPSVGRNVRYLQLNNALQNDTVRAAASMLGPQDRYYDGVFMLVTRPTAAHAWLEHRFILQIQADAARGEHPLIERVLRGEPKVWILNYRTAAIWDILEPFLRTSYVRVGANLLLAGVRLTPGEETAFNVRWGGSYRVVGRDGTPRVADLRIDGRSVDGPVHLAPGPHTVVVAGADAPLYLLPADVNTAVPGQVVDQRPLFYYAHSF